MKIPTIFTNKKELVYFLSSVLLCSIFFILVYSPVADVSGWKFHNPWGVKLYTTVLVFIGFCLLVLLRIILFQLQKHFHFGIVFYVFWVVGELMLFTLLLSIVSYMIVRGETSYYIILVRAFLDVIAVLFVPYMFVAMVFVIRDRNRKIAELTTRLSVTSSSELEDVKEKEVLDVVPQTASMPVVDTLNFYDRSGRFVFSTRISNVLYVESADNYCNIHYINDNREDYYILHNSMKNVNEAYADKGLLRCHRCYMVNVEKVKLVKKVKEGLVLELLDTEKVVPVSKTYTDVVVKYFVK